MDSGQDRADAADAAAVSDRIGHIDSPVFIVSGAYRPKSATYALDPDTGARVELHAHTFTDVGTLYHAHDAGSSFYRHSHADLGAFAPAHHAIADSDA